MNDTDFSERWNERHSDAYRPNTALTPEGFLSKEDSEDEARLRFQKLLDDAKHEVSRIIRDL